MKELVNNNMEKEDLETQALINTLKILELHHDLIKMEENIEDRRNRKRKLIDYALSGGYIESIPHYYREAYKDYLIDLFEIL